MQADEFVCKPFDIEGLDSTESENVFLKTTVSAERFRASRAKRGGPTDSLIGFCQWFLDRYHPEKYDDVKRKFLMSGRLRDGGNNILKYLDLFRWVEAKYRVMLKLELDKANKRLILDLGSGACHFDLLAEFYGHKVVEIDVLTPQEQFLLSPEITDFYRAHGEFFRHPVIDHEILPFRSLPSFGARFDLVTAFMTFFNKFPDKTPWGVSEWKYFVCELRSMLNEEGRLFLQLTRPFCPPEVRSFIAGLSETHDEKKCEFLIPASALG